jgi:hypothetical protein
MARALYFAGVKLTSLLLSPNYLQVPMFALKRLVS